MAIAQTSAPTYGPSAAGREGMISDMRRNNDMVSRVAPSGGIKVGRFVTGVAAQIGCAYPASSANVTEGGLGFSVIDAGRPQASPLFPQYAEVPILRSGRMWVIAEDVVTYGKPVFVRFTAEAPDLDLGTVRSDADTDKAVALPDSKFLGTTTDVNQLVEIEFSIS